MAVKVGLGQDSHRFGDNPAKPLILGGVAIPDEPGLEGNSDADVILHALCNAISGVSGRTVLGPLTDKLCAQGVVDSAEYVREALKTLGAYRIAHLSCSLECQRPRMVPHIDAIRNSLARLLGVAFEDVMVTATSGEGLTDFGRGFGIQALVIVTAERD